MKILETIITPFISLINWVKRAFLLLYRGIQVSEVVLATPLYNLFSLFVAFIGCIIPLLPSILDLKLSTVQSLSTLDQWILSFFLIEMGIRTVSWRKGYIFSIHFFIDLASILPLIIHWILFSALEMGLVEMELIRLVLDFPGINMIREIRVLRLFYFFRFFYKQSQVGIYGEPINSPVKIKFFSGISALLFLLIIFIGNGISMLHYSLILSRMHSRVERIRDHFNAYGATAVNEAFQDIVIKIEKEGTGENFLISNMDNEYVKSHMSYGRDYIQLDGTPADTTIWISFHDLTKQHRLLELGIIAIGAMAVLIVVLSLNLYLDRLILDPLDRVRRVIEIRLKGEEVGDTLEHPDHQRTEITDLIFQVDIMYKKLTAKKGDNPVHKIAPLNIRKD